MLLRHTFLEDKVSYLNSYYVLILGEEIILSLTEFSVKYKENTFSAFDLLVNALPLSYLLHS